MIRPTALDVAPPASRHQLLRLGFLSATAFAATELLAALAPFIRVTRITGLGAAVALSDSKADLHRVADRRPAPRGLDLFHLAEEAGILTVKTNPFTLMVRDDNKWHPGHLEVRA